MFDIALTLEQSPQTIPTNSLNLNIIKYYHILVAYTIRPNTVVAVCAASLVGLYRTKRLLLMSTSDVVF